MTIYGVSQTSGVERRLTVERGGEGVVLAIVDHVGDQERARISVPPDDLLTAITDPPAGGATITGFAPPHGAEMRLSLEVRRNEVLLRADGGPTPGADVAVGLDDLQDALEGVISRG
jgi:hypothetical protein